jgi:parallel beta-helix repeat protein
MKRQFYLLACFIAVLALGKAQNDNVTYERENFDGNTISLSPRPESAWRIDANHSVSAPNSYRGMVPIKKGDSTVLETPPYDFHTNGYTHVVLRFSHICKISPRDVARIEYKTKNQSWRTIPSYAYLGSAMNYVYGFNSASYLQWNSGDSLEQPNSNWWKEELFDMGSLVGKDEEVQFRFVIKHGNTAGTNISYGWLLDNFEVIASKYEVLAPVVQFVSPSVQDTVYSTGLFTINAKVKTRTTAPIKTPYLKYTSVFNNISSTDSVEMTHVSGDSLWKGVLPQFEVRTLVTYSVTGYDTNGNNATDKLNYVVAKRPGKVSIIQNNQQNLTHVPVARASYYSYSQQIYLASELGKAGTISSIAFDCNTPDTTQETINILMGYTSQTYFAAVGNYIPYSNLTPVYSGTYRFNSKGWNSIDLQTPFDFDGHKNLVVVVEKRTGKSSQVYFAGEETANNMSICYYGGSPINISATPPSGGASSLYKQRSNIKISFLGNDTNSAALTGIKSPLSGQNPVGQTFVDVTFRNRGDSALTSLDINWSLNGELKTIQPHTWTGNLPWDFEHTEQLGDFLPRLKKADTVVVWISKPNGVSDATTFDDTLTVITYGCPVDISGHYPVGGDNEFKKLQDALDFFQKCNPTGDVILELESDTIKENWNFTTINSFMNGHKLTITSKKNHRDSVVLRPNSGTAIVLGNTSNLTLEAITVDISHLTSSNTYGIQFNNACSNIVINSCKIKASITATTSSIHLIYKASNSGIVDNIIITNNVLDGGYSGFAFAGGTGTNAGQFGTNVVFDSNTVSNQYYYGLNPDYTAFKSVSYNTFLSRETAATSTWEALRMYRSNGDVVGNRIQQRNTANITNPRGIYSYYHNYYLIADTALIANNEIIIHTTGAHDGIQASYSRSKILHNSIHVRGSGAARGIYINEVGYYNVLVIKNNNIIMGSAAAYPIYISSANNIGNYNINNNNYYASTYIGNIAGTGGDKFTMDAWTRAVVTDVNSVKIRPGFAGDSTKSLKLSSYTGLQCLPVWEIDYDINNLERVGVTTMGCYHGDSLYNVNANLSNIHGWREGVISGMKDSVKVILTNTGETPLANASIKWTFNGTESTASWSGTLERGETVSVTLGEITYIPGEYIIKAWINNLGNLQDEYPKDDTTSVSGFVCSSVYNAGTYIVAKTGGVFTSVEEAVKKISLCGVNGNIILEIQTGEYSNTVDLTDISSLLGNNKLTIKSQSGNAGDVILKTKSIGFSMAGSNNIEIDGVTIDATEGVVGVQFLDACTNVVIQNCIILLDTTVTSDKYAGIYKATGTNAVDSVFIMNNIIEGGHTGIWLYGTSSAYDNHIAIDNNNISKQSHYGLYLYYTDFISISYNTISTRLANINSSWTGINMSSTIGDIVGNRIKQLNKNISYGYGINMSSHNHQATELAFIANNELNVYIGSGYAGLNVSSTRAFILHNSIYVRGNAGSRGLSISDGNSNRLIVKNNNFIMDVTGTTATFPVYISGTTNVALYEFDANNYYDTKFIGAIGYSTGANKETMKQWQETFFTDVNSVKARPVFVDSNVNLKHVNYDSIKCYALPEIPTDIQDSLRSGEFTAMGCYHGFISHTKNAELSELLSWNDGQIYGTKDTVKVVITNTSSTLLTPQTISWTFNGNAKMAVSSTKTLAYQQRDTIVLGEISYNLGHNTLIAWIDNSQDNYPADDTLQIRGYVCSAAGINGTFIVGETGDFKTMNAALRQIENCGVNGDITLKVESGIYPENIDLTDYASLLGTHKLTITSVTGKAKDVTFKTMSTGITLSQSNNIVIEFITVDAEKGSNAIQFSGACTNVVIRNNVLLANPTTTSMNAYPIYKASNNTGIVDSIFIINNEIKGGHTGIFFYGGTGTGAGQFGTNVVFDNNDITNIYLSGINSQNIDFISVSNNTILSRTENVSTSTYSMSWQGIRLENCNGSVMNNQIIQQTNAIPNPTGIYLSNFNRYLTTDTALIANNEVILSATGSPSGTTYPNSGIYTNASRTKIINNSISVSGISAARGIYIANDNESRTVAQNNNIVMVSATAHPIYLNSISNMSLCDLDYNNMYAPTYVGYASGAKNTIDNWQETVESDKHSVRIYPNFIDLTTNMDLLDTVLSCPVYENVITDINGNTRVASGTTMGAYQYMPKPNDVHPVELVGINPTYPVGTTVPLQVLIVNSGSDTLKSALISWTTNNVLPYNEQLWQGILAPGEEKLVPVTAGSLTIGSGNTDLILFTTLPNNTTDTRTFNDTLRASIYACNSMLHGTYTVGAGEDIEDLETVLDLLANCGIDGMVTFELSSNATPYTLNRNIGTYPGADFLNRIIFTSSTSKAEDVVIISDNTAALTLEKAQYITLKNVTIGNSSSNVGLCFLETCKNIEVDNCIISVNPAATATTSRGIEYEGSSASGNKLDNIFITNNTIKGGYYNVYFSYSGSSSNAVSDITFDNNTLTDAYSHGFYSTQWGHFRSISNNTIKTRSANTIQYGIRIENRTSIGELAQNKIHVLGTSNSFGIYLNSEINTSNTQAKENANIVNNEIIIANTTGNTASVGLYTASVRANIFHNSVYLAGTGACYGWQIAQTSFANSMVAKNNIFATATSNAANYSVHTTNANYVTTTGGTVLDYNNYHTTGTNLAFVVSAVTTLDDLRTATGQDANSKDKAPVFADYPNNLELADSIICPVNPAVLSDIRDVLRLDSTNIGAYGIALKKVDVAAMEILLSSEQTLPAIRIKNTGKDTITSIEINSIYNGRVKSPVSWTEKIASMEEVWIDLDTIIPNSGYNTITAWINNVNGGGLDSLQLNDTATINYYLCNGGLAGTYTVGKPADFETVADFVDVVNQCGVKGAVILAFKNGEHDVRFDVSSISSILGTHPLTITSENKDSSLVKLVASAGNDAVILLGNNTNITIKDVTIDARQANYGIQFVEACSNIVIEKCAVYANSTASADTYAPIHKGTTGLVDNIRISNSLLDGGYAALWFHGGLSQDAYGKNVMIDSNTASNQSHYGIYLRFTDFSTISHNTVWSRTSDVNSSWCGLYTEYTNGTIIANSIIQKSDDISNPTGMSVRYFNYRHTTDMGRIVNNEVILHADTTAIPYAMKIGWSNVEIIHNSVYVTGTSATRGLGLEDGGTSTFIIKNNNIVLTAQNAYPIHIANNFIVKSDNIDYNNYYAPQYIGYVGGTYATLESWKERVPSDQHSVKVLPNFTTPETTLALADYAHLLCPLYEDITEDIDNRSRIVVTTMGAYTQNVSSLDVMLSNLKTNEEVVDKQEVFVDVSAMNVGSTPVDRIVFGWSVNGIPQSPMTWRTQNALNVFEGMNTTIGSYKAVDSNKFDIIVWIDSINYVKDPVSWNDTLSTTSVVVPLAEFAAPFVADTIYSHSFNVYVKIMEETGATIHTPEMNIQTIANNGDIFDNTIEMKRDNGLWVANIPQQYYDSKVIYSLTVTDTITNDLTIVDSVYLQYKQGSELYVENNLSILSIERLVPEGESCIDDYAPVKITLANTGGEDYDFSANPITLGVEVTNPIPFYKDTVLTSGGLLSGQAMVIELTNELPIITAGSYDVKTWVNSPLDKVIYDDTLLYDYVSGKFGLPVDEDFSSPKMPLVFEVDANTTHEWKIVSQGTGADTVVKPKQGTGMLAFSGTPGAISTLTTRQLDLSRAIQPTLTFWYFHDTIPCDDYTLVRLSVDGGTTDADLFTLTKYDTAWGWKEYNVDLPVFAINQCVVLEFEAMEMSYSGDVTQYIDRILVTAKQEIAITDIITSDLSVCDMEDKEWKIVLSNLTDPDLDYKANPVEITFEFIGTPYRFTHMLDSGVLEGFSSDTLTMVRNFDFLPGRYAVRAYISSIIGGEIFVKTIIVNPSFSIRMHKISELKNPVLAGVKYQQVITIRNNGNMKLSENIELILTVDTNRREYFTTTKRISLNLSPRDSIEITFDSAYTVPWIRNYEANVHGYLICDPAMVNTIASVLEDVDVIDLALVNIEKPLTDEVDVVGSQKEIEVKLKNRSLGKTYNPGDVKMGILITDTNGNPIGDVPIVEEINVSIGMGSAGEITYAFNGKTYPVPALGEYYLVVYIQDVDEYHSNDTLKMRRKTDYKDVSISNVNKVSFTMEQNIPNPANNKTVIKYNIPQDGEITFAVYSVNGQLLYSQKETVFSGDNQIELNTSDYASGIYFYTMEYKGQRLTKQMSITR